MNSCDVKPGMVVKFNRGLKRLHPLYTEYTQPGDLAVVVGPHPSVNDCFNLMHSKSGRVDMWNAFYFSKAK